MTTKEFAKGWKHFCSCIDFGNSNLDAEAIRFMNEALGKITTQHDALLAACKDYQKAITMLYELNPTVEICVGSGLALKQAEESGKAAIAQAEKQA